MSKRAHVEESEGGRGEDIAMKKETAKEGTYNLNPSSLTSSSHERLG
jgi:hypothetical protein